MTPLAAKLLLLLSATALFWIVKRLFKGTLKEDVSAQLILIVAATPLLGAATLIAMVYLFKFAFAYV